MFGKVFVLLLCYISSVEGTPYCPDATNSGTDTNVECEGFFCQDPDLTNGRGALLPSATVCENELSDADCQRLFPCAGYAYGALKASTGLASNPTATDADRTGGLICNPDYITGSATTVDPLSLSPPTSLPMVRAPGCSRPELRDTALQCAKQCAMCCETAAYSCEDDDDSPIDCELNKNKCTVSNWTNIMATYCPQTCGLCTSGTCTDLNSGCSTMTALCKNVDWIDYMTTNCARTCGTCSTSSTATTTSSTCSNIASNCVENAGLCTNSVYRSLMLQQCCATCSGTSGGSTCTDSSTSCSNWVSNGFCSSSFYTTAQKQQYCASSCNLC